MKRSNKKTNVKNFNAGEFVEFLDDKLNESIGDMVITFPCTEEQLVTLANGLINGMSFTERVWSGDGKLYSVPEFSELKTVLFAHGLIEYSENNKRQGIRLTEKGNLAMRELANSPTPPEDMP